MIKEEDWQDLVELIAQKKCTPFIGAGACSGTLRMAGAIAGDWAVKHSYPLADVGDLARVSQYLSIDRYEMFPKEMLKKEFQGKGPPDFTLADEPHAVLADLELPIYITTNYDRFMAQAIESRNRTVVREFCRWNRFPEVVGGSPNLDKDYLPTPARPMVFHLHGNCEIPQSMVLTESDYLDFLIRLTRDQDLLPASVRTALAGTSLLFVGYSLSDWNFRVLLRGLIGSLGANLGYSSIAVQLGPDGLTEERLKRAQDYLLQYFNQIQKIKVHLYWGDIRHFSRELRQRWEKHKHGA
jgi:hypothetical protein